MSAAVKLAIWNMAAKLTLVSLWSLKDTYQMKKTKKSNPFIKIPGPEVEGQVVTGLKTSTTVKWNVSSRDVRNLPSTIVLMELRINRLVVKYTVNYTLTIHAKGGKMQILQVFVLIVTQT